MPSKEKENKSPKKKKTPKKSPILKLKNELKSLSIDLDDQKDKYLRLKAEFDNYRRRKEKDTINLLKYDGEAIIKSCINGLTGGASQMLWPAYSECVFSIMFHINSSEQTTEEPNPLLCNWLQSAMADQPPNSAIPITHHRDASGQRRTITQQGESNKERERLQR